MYTMQPGKMCRNTMWEDCSATELLMLNQMFWRVSKRLERMKGYTLIEDGVVNPLQQEIDSLADDTLFETAIRLVPEDSATEFLLHTPMRDVLAKTTPASPA